MQVGFFKRKYRNPSAPVYAFSEHILKPLSPSIMMEFWEFLAA
jgi:hypothetical protein